MTQEIQTLATNPSSSAQVKPDAVSKILSHDRKLAENLVSLNGTQVEAFSACSKGSTTLIVKALLTPFPVGMFKLIHNDAVIKVDCVV